MYDGNIVVAKEVIPSTLMTVVTGSSRCWVTFVRCNVPLS